MRRRIIRMRRGRLGILQRSHIVWCLVDSLGLVCTAGTLDNCSESQKSELQPFLDMPPDERAAALAEAKAKLNTSHASYDAAMESLKAEFKALKEKGDEQDARLKELRSEFKEAEQKFDAVCKEELMPRIRMLMAATKAGAKDEL